MQVNKTSDHQSDLRHFGPLTKQVTFVPMIFEATGARGPKADQIFQKWCAESEALRRKRGGQNYRSLGMDHTWNAMKYANLYSQLFSFAIVRDLALSVVRAVERAARRQTLC